MLRRASRVSDRCGTHRPRDRAYDQHRRFFWRTRGRSNSSFATNGKNTGIRPSGFCRQRVWASHRTLFGGDFDFVTPNQFRGGYLVVYYPHLLVLPDYHGRGIGTELMRMLLKRYEGFHQHILVADGRAGLLPQLRLPAGGKDRTDVDLRRSRPLSCSTSRSWKTLILRWFLLAVLIACWNVPGAEVRHYVFFGSDRERVSDAAFLGTKRFQGAQLKYSWRELEPEPDVYDFSAIEHDLRFLTSKGKGLFLQLQDVTFDPTIINVPKYLLNDPRYEGGAAKQYTIPDDDEARAVPEGWVARRWDSAVQERFHRLLAALGRQFDGQIEGINLAETAVSFGESGRLHPKGFSPSSYRDAILTNMLALKRSFPKSVTMQYANFMPGEWLPDDDRGYLRSVYEEAKRSKVGVGGPDLLPFRRGQLAHAYPLIRASTGIIPTGIAVQEGNYASVNPETGKRVSVEDLIGFATEHLKVDYMFWCNEEPFYSRDLIPFLQICFAWLSLNSEVSASGIAVSSAVYLRLNVAWSAVDNTPPSKSNSLDSVQTS